MNTAARSCLPQLCSGSIKRRRSWDLHFENFHNYCLSSMTPLKKKSFFALRLLPTMSNLQDHKKDTKKRMRAAPGSGADSGGTQCCWLPWPETTAIPPLSATSRKRAPLIFLPWDLGILYGNPLQDFFSLKLSSPRICFLRSLPSWPVHCSLDHTVLGPALARLQYLISLGFYLIHSCILKKPYTA